MFQNVLLIKSLGLKTAYLGNLYRKDIKIGTKLNTFNFCSPV
jgi:hypothetical protein